MAVLQRSRRGCTESADQGMENAAFLFWRIDLTRHSQFHASGNDQDDFVKAEFAEIRQTIQLEKLNKQNGWSVFVKTPGNRKRLLLIVLTSFFSQCSGNGIASYYLHDILQSVGVTRSYDQSLVNGGLQIWSFLVAVGFSQLVDRVGRRKLFLIAAVGMLLSFSVWTGCSAVYAESGNQGAGSAVIAMVFLFYFAAGFAWPGLTVAYVAEILPFNIRAKGMAIGFACTSAASVLNQVRLSWTHGCCELKLTAFLVRESDRPREAEMALLFRLHRHPCDRSAVRLLPVRGDQRSYFGGDCDPVRRTQCFSGRWAKEECSAAGESRLRGGDVAY